MTRLLVQKTIGMDLPLSPARPGDAGLDLMNAGLSVTLSPGDSMAIPCGIRVKIPDGHFGLLLPRSSTFVKKGLVVPPSVIDEGYVGDLFVVVWNVRDRYDGSGHTRIQTGERVAQLVIVPYLRPEVELVDRLPETARGSNGFGSTG
jgi:dUTP pyrophosphatase